MCVNLRLLPSAADCHLQITSPVAAFPTRLVLPPRRFLHTFIAVGVTIAAFGLFVAETLDIVIGASLAAAIMLLTGACGMSGAGRTGLEHTSGT